MNDKDKQLLNERYNDVVSEYTFGQSSMGKKRSNNARMIRKPKPEKHRTGKYKPFTSVGKGKGHPQFGSAAQPSSQPAEPDAPAESPPGLPDPTAGIKNYDAKQDALDLLMAKKAAASSAKAQAVPQPPSIPDPTIDYSQYPWEPDEVDKLLELGVPLDVLDWLSRKWGEKNLDPAPVPPPVPEP